MPETTWVVGTKRLGEKKGLVAWHKVRYFMVRVKEIASCTIFYSKFPMRGSACKGEYMRISYDRQHPTNLMIPVSTPGQKRSMMSAVWKYCTDTSLDVKPNMGPIKQTASFRVFLISIGMVLTKRPSLLKVPIF